MSPSSVVDDEHIGAIEEIRLPRNRDELPGPPAGPTLHTTPDRTDPSTFLQQRKQEDTSVRSSSDGCAKVKA
jgi:hypothetical protein